MSVAPTASLAAARTRLGWALVRRLLDECPTANAFVSPHSLAGALAVAQAAGVAEAQSIGQMLESEDPSAHASVSDALEDPDTEAVKLRFAQSLWTDLSLGFARADSVREHFPDVDWRARDFRDPATVAEMNAWAAERTDGLIDSIVQEIPDDEVLAVLDAILFVGTWAQPIDPARTRPAPFRTGAGATVEVPLMELSLGAHHADGDGWSAVRLPYGSGRVGLVLVLPAQGVALAEFAQRFEWAPALAALSQRRGVVRLPRFRLDAVASLLAHLRALGLGEHDGPALDTALRISRIMQRAVLEVDEEGTRAAAVTFLGAEITSVGPAPFEFVADRPFLCAVHDRVTDSLLFVGAVQHPEPIVE